MWGTLFGGAPTGPLELPRGPLVSESSGKNFKNSQKLYKKYTCKKIPQTILPTPILGYLDALGGPRGVKIFRGAP